MSATISLAGVWRCELDRADEGLAQRWFSRRLATEIELPNSLSVLGMGDEITPETAWTGTIFDRAYFDSPAYAPYREPGHIKVPFCLQPETVYVGAAWFQRPIEVPEAWAGKNIVLTLERPHWQTRVWLDEQEIGTGDSLSTPHIYDLGAVSAGAHWLTIRVDNRLHIEVGENAHSVSDHTQGNWNGLIGEITLTARETAWIEDLQVIPYVATRSISVRGLVRGATAGSVELRVEKPHAQTHADIRPDGTFSADLALGEDAPLWDEFTPTVCRLTARLPLAQHERSITFGLREIATEGRQLIINGRPLFLRGTLDCCIFPLTGHPPMDVDSWRKVLRTIQAHGLNHVRFHSWCPPEAAFIAGDELGVYFQVESNVWPNSVAVLAFNSPAGIGDGKSVDGWVFAETERILRTYGNHPCFVLMAAGNEPGGPHHREYLSKWVAHFRAKDPRRLYTGAAGWPELPENQFHVIPEPRLHQWGDGLGSRLNAQPPASDTDYRATISSREIPVISHEIGQWCAYPPLRDVSKYRGHLKARNYEIFAESLTAHGMADQADDFLHASGKLQALCYKEEIEAALRTPEMGGFQLLGLQDFPGQQTAPVGMLESFWESKGYLKPEAMRRFCHSTVPLARLGKRIYTTDESLEAAIEVAHFGAAPLEPFSIAWKLVSDDQTVLGSGELAHRPIPIGNGTLLGRIQVKLKDVPAPARCRLVVSIDGAYENDWEIWVYPPPTDFTPPANISITRSGPEALAKLRTGGTVLLFPPLNELRREIALGFSPIFWNTACTQGQAPHTLGILCDPQHPAFMYFPTDSHTNWPWWYLLRRAAVLVLDDLPLPMRPIIQVIDDWFTNRKLGLLFEAQVGPGKLLVCSIDLHDSVELDPVGLQLRQSLLRYAASSAFQPTLKLSDSQLHALLDAQVPKPSSLVG